MRLLVFSAMLAFASCDAGEFRLERIRINVHDSDDVIRQELLRYTPLGADVNQILEFVHTRLYCEGGFSSGVGVMPRPQISVGIGHEFKSVFVHGAVEANWHFDEGRKLREVEIRRYNQEGMYHPGQNPSSKPKVRIDLHQSDEAIRQELLKHTPLGSSLVDVGRFIQMRLYCQSGEANGIPLTGHPGIAVVLGEYIDGNNSSRKSVIINWQFPDGEARPRLEGIEIKRSSL